jgi:hypothetical protein
LLSSLLDYLFRGTSGGADAPVFSLSFSRSLYLDDTRLLSLLSLVSSLFFFLSLYITLLEDERSVDGGRKECGFPYGELLVLVVMLLPLPAAFISFQHILLM